MTLAVKLVNPDCPQCCSSLVAMKFAAVKPDTKLQVKLKRCLVIYKSEIRQLAACQSECIASLVTINNCRNVQGVNVVVKFQHLTKLKKGTCYFEHIRMSQEIITKNHTATFFCC